MAIAKPKKFGQILLDHGWITKDQLQRALQNQSVVGGRIGTCLLEMDALPEDLVMKALAEQHNVPAASAEDLRNVPEEIHRLLPARVARRCRAIGFQAIGTQLSIALLDVRNLQIQDELAFVTARRLKVHVANEARIYEALEKYYGEECPQRFSHLIDRLNRARYMWDKADEEARQQRPTTQSGRLVAEAEATPPRATTGTSAVPSFAAPAVAVAAPVEVVAPPAEGIHTAPRIAAAAGAPVAAPAAPAPVPAAAVPPPAPAMPAPRPATMSIPVLPEERAAMRGAPPPAPTLTLADVETRLLNPRDRDDVGKTLLAYLSQDFTRVLLFKAVKNTVEGWMGQGDGVQPEALQAYSVPFNQPSVFLNMKQGSQFFLGTLAPMPAHRDLARVWGGDIPKESLILPVRIKDRVAMYVYLDGGSEGLSGVDMEALQRVSAKAAIAFELCIMRSKLKQA